MINTLSNMYGEIPLVVKVPHYTRASGTREIRVLMTHDISPHGLDNVILSAHVLPLSFKNMCSVLTCQKIHSCVGRRVWLGMKVLTIGGLEFHSLSTYYLRDAN